MKAEVFFALEVSVFELRVLEFCRTLSLEDPAVKVESLEDSSVPPQQSEPSDLSGGRLNGAPEQVLPIINERLKIYCAFGIAARRGRNRGRGPIVRRNL